MGTKILRASGLIHRPDNTHFPSESAGSDAVFVRSAPLFFASDLLFTTTFHDLSAALLPPISSILRPLFQTPRQRTIRKVRVWFLSGQDYVDFALFRNLSY
jgi:hypothetical protein